MIKKSVITVLALRRDDSDPNLARDPIKDKNGSGGLTKALILLIIPEVTR